MGPVTKQKFNGAMKETVLEWGNQVRRLTKR